MKWIGSYAGYGVDLVTFFIDVLKGMADRNRHLHVLDPMCGSGSLLCACHNTGIKYTGYDLNPIQVIQCKAKLTGFSKAEFEEVKEKVRNLPFAELNETLIADNWFHPNVETALTDVHNKLQELSTSTAVSAILDAAFYLSLRQNACFGASSNPTWLKKGGILAGTSFRRGMLDSLDFIQSWKETNVFNLDVTTGNIECRDVVTMGHHDVFDIVITSPPYCNRMDYKRLFAPEYYLYYKLNPTSAGLANFLGDNEVKMFDATTYKPTAYESELLAAIRLSQSPDDKDYYFKYYCKYFYELEQMLNSVIRAVKHNGILLINTQNSRYKGIQINIDDIICKKIEEKHFIEPVFCRDRNFFGNIKDSKAQQKETVLRILKQ